MREYEYEHEHEHEWSVVGIGEDLPRWTLLQCSFALLCRGLARRLPAAWLRLGLGRGGLHRRGGVRRHGRRGHRLELADDGLAPVRHHLRLLGGVAVDHGATLGGIIAP